MPSKVPLVIAADAWAGDEFGGQFKIASELALHCAAHGRPVHYVCPDVKALGARAAEGGVQVWRYPTSRPGAHALARFRSHIDGAANALRQVAAEVKGDFVLNGHGPLPYYAGVRLGGLPALRRVMTVHSPLSHEYRANAGGSLGPVQALTHAVFRRIERASYAKSDLVQCFSQYISGLVAASLGSKRPPIAVCPAYVDYATMALELPRREARRRLAEPCWQTDDVCFFSLRRHARRMGLDTLIRAFARLRERGSALPAHRLILGGEGPEHSALKELARGLGLEDRIHFIGRIEEAQKPLHYRAADCFVLPTAALEGFGLIVLEAFAAGTPVIATPVGAIPEVVDGFGALTAGTGEAAIADALTHFLADPAAAQSNEAARRAYARTFDRTVVLPRLEALVMGEGR